MQRRSNCNLLDVKFCWYCFLGLRDEVLCDITDIFWRQQARMEYERKGVKDDTNVFSSNIMIDCVAINWDREDCDEWTLGLEFCNSVLGMLILRWLSKSHWKQLNRQLNEFRSLKFRESSRERYLVAQTVKASAYTMRETQVQSLGWEDSPGEGNGNPLQYSCLENPMDGGAW